MYSLSYKTAKKTFGEQADQTVIKEVKQMITKGVYEFTKGDVSLPDNTNVLRSHMFLKQKSNGIIKARLVAGGNGMDRNIYGKEVRSSPTVHVENMLIQIGYTTMSRMKMCSLDVEGAFLDNHLPEPTFMRLSDTLLM